MYCTERNPTKKLKFSSKNKRKSSSFTLKLEKSNFQEETQTESFPVASKGRPLTNYIVLSTSSLVHSDHAHNFPLSFLPFSKLSLQNNFQPATRPKISSVSSISTLLFKPYLNFLSPFSFPLNFVFQDICLRLLGRTSYLSRLLKLPHLDMPVLEKTFTLKTKLKVIQFAQLHSSSQAACNSHMHPSMVIL